MTRRSTWIDSDTKERGIASNEEHRGIMEAIKAGNPKEAERLATLHMENAYDNIVKSGLYDIFEAEEKQQ